MTEALEVALVIGISYTEFWKITPFELEIAKKAYSDRQTEKYNANVILACQTAFYSRVEKLSWTDWKNDIIKEEKQLVEMSDEQLLNQIKTLNAMLGGTITNGS